MGCCRGAWAGKALGAHSTAALYWRCQPCVGWVRPAPCLLSLDASVPNVQVTKLTLMCEQAPGPITMDLTGERWWGGSHGGREEEEGVPG